MRNPSVYASVVFLFSVSNLGLSDPMAAILALCLPSSLITKVSAQADSFQRLMFLFDNSCQMGDLPRQHFVGRCRHFLSVLEPTSEALPRAFHSMNLA